MSGSSGLGGDDPRSRLTDVGNDGRLDHWDVAIHAFRDDPVTGTGAGDFASPLARRDITLKVETRIRSTWSSCPSSACPASPSS